MTHGPLPLSRRLVLGLIGAAALPRPGRAAAPREITWDYLIPPGVPYSEIIADGEMDAATDTWKPVYDENGAKLNTALDGETVRLPGYIIPLDLGADGVTSFVLVPYVGACIHVPPPPANQLVLVTTEKPWPGDELWDAIWVTGRLQAKPQSNELGDIGYEITAEAIERYDWDAENAKAQQQGQP
jgi:hypothetical protein